MCVTLSWTILLSTSATNLVLTARLVIQTERVPSIGLTHAMVNVRGCELPRIPQTSKRQATSVAATLAKTRTSCKTPDELAERFGSFHESACTGHLPADVLRKTDQSMIEAAKCMFHKLLEEVKDEKSLYRDQTEQTTMFAYRDIESESLSSRNRAKNMYIKCQEKRQCRNLQPGYQSKLSRMILGSSSSCRYLSVALESGN